MINREMTNMARSTLPVCSADPMRVPTAPKKNMGLRPIRLPMKLFVKQPKSAPTTTARPRGTGQRSVVAASLSRGNAHMASTAPCKELFVNSVGNVPWKCGDWRSAFAMPWSYLVASVSASGRRDEVQPYPKSRKPAAQPARPEVSTRCWERVNNDTHRGSSRRRAARL